MSRCGYLSEGDPHLSGRAHTAPQKFSPALSGLVAGSVAAQRTYDRGWRPPDLTEPWFGCCQPHSHFTELQRPLAAAGHGCLINEEIAQIGPLSG